VRIKWKTSHQKKGCSTRGLLLEEKGTQENARKNSDAGEKLPGQQSACQEQP